MQDWRQRCEAKANSLVTETITWCYPLVDRPYWLCGACKRLASITLGSCERVADGSVPKYLLDFCTVCLGVRWQQNKASPYREQLVRCDCKPCHCDKDFGVMATEAECL